MQNDAPSCSCLPEFLGSPPYCRPECISNGECASNLICQNQKCVDPCPKLCGINAECHVISHIPNCICYNGYVGDPYSECSLPNIKYDLRPCQPTPCGSNAICKELNGAGACLCLPEYIGNPYEGCRPECVLNTDCPSNKACFNNKCKDPCPGTCAQNTNCYVVNHIPNCLCIEGFTGDPFVYCQILQLIRKKNSLISIQHIKQLLYSCKRRTHKPMPTLSVWTK